MSARGTLLGRLRTAAAVALAGVLLASCAGGGEDGRSADGTVTLDYFSLAWQKESVAANKKLVAQWNRTHEKVKVRYVQGQWDTVHDQLLTSFEGGEAPDIIHDDASDLTDFAYGGYLADLRGLLPKELLADIPQRTWDSTTMNGGRVYGVPFSQEPRVIIANEKLLRRSGVRVPTPEHPWTWGEFEKAARELSGRTAKGGRRYGAVWTMKEPVKQSVNLSLSTGGRVFTREGTGTGNGTKGAENARGARGAENAENAENAVRFDHRDSAVSELIDRQVRQGTAPRSGLGMAGSDALPGLFAGRYAMAPLNFSFRQQVAQQAPDGFDWTVLPMPRGPGRGQNAQGVVPQTLSVAEESPHKRAAARFVAYLSRPEHMTALAKGDWLLPTGEQALRDPAINRREDGWDVGVETADTLRPSPTLGVRGFAEWSDKIATPAFQRYYRGDIRLGALRESLVEDGNLILDRYQR